MTVVAETCMILSDRWRHVWSNPSFRPLHVPIPAVQVRYTGEGWPSFTGRVSEYKDKQIKGLEHLIFLWTNQTNVWSCELTKLMYDPDSREGMSEEEFSEICIKQLEEQV